MSEPNLGSVLKVPSPPEFPRESREVKVKKKIKTQSKTSLIEAEETELLSLSNIILSLNANFTKISLIRNTYIESQLQVGPKCGLVALSMASSATDNFVNVDDIFQTALSLGYTKHGEMFSVDWLSELAYKCCGFKTNVLKGGLKRHFSCLIHNLLNQSLILVPYDSDLNHFPCCKKGVKAHWAVISGFVIFEEKVVEKEEKKIEDECSYCSKKKMEASEVEVSGHSGRITLKSESGTRTGKVYLIGKQGKSKHPGVWSFDDLADSNNNLVCTDRSSEEYLLPEGGIVRGLKGNAVVLNHPSISIISNICTKPF